MTLRGRSLDLDTTSPILPDASHPAVDRDGQSRRQASVPPGASCRRCSGLLVLSYTATLEWDITGKPMALWRCVNCGDCVDHDILANQGKDSGSVQSHPRPPIGPQYPRTTAQSGSRHDSVSRSSM
jgi:hypothetical protein